MGPVPHGWLNSAGRGGYWRPAYSRSRTRKPIAGYGEFPSEDESAIIVRAPIANQGWVRVAAVPVDVAKQQRAIEDYHRAFAQLSSQQRAVKRNYLWLLTVIALFILFVASWLAHYLARQISGPISAVLGAVEEVSRGNLGYRLKVTAVDELAQLVSGFNRMTADLEANRTEIEARRRFTEAILESIPTGVISVDSERCRAAREQSALGRIQIPIPSRETLTVWKICSRVRTRRKSAI